MTVEEKVFKNKINELTIKNKNLKKELLDIKSSASYKLANFIIEKTIYQKNLALKLFAWFRLLWHKKLQKIIQLIKPTSFLFTEQESLVGAIKLSIEQEKLSNGVTVLMPCYSGEEYIERALLSLKAQTLDCELFEVVIVFNGKLDKSSYIVHQFCHNNPHISFKLFFQNEANVSAARNIAIEHASKKYSVFLDVDDELSPNYLANMLKAAAPHTIVYSDIKNIRPTHDTVDKFIVHTRKIGANLSPRFNDLMPLLTKNGCKLIPTYYLKYLSFDCELKSGEDVVFFSELYATFRPQISLSHCFSETFYIRHMVTDSVSRREQSYFFCVLQRLDVIARIDQLYRIDNHKLVKYLLANFINFQLNFITEYIYQHPDSFDQFKSEDIISYLDYDVVSALNEKLYKYNGSYD